MKFSRSCPSCGHVITVWSGFFFDDGYKLKCPKCHKRFRAIKLNVFNYLLVNPFIFMFCILLFLNHLFHISIWNSTLLNIILITAAIGILRGIVLSLMKINTNSLTEIDKK